MLFKLNRYTNNTALSKYIYGVKKKKKYTYKNQMGNNNKKKYLQIILKIEQANYAKKKNYI